MKPTLVLFAILCSTFVIAQTNKVQLPNGWSLSPAGRSIGLGDLPLNIAVSNNKKMLAVTNNGQSTQSIQLIDAASEKVLDSITIAKSWYGLTFSSNDKFLYASGGNDNWIVQYQIINKKLQLIDTIQLGKKWPEKISPTGIATDDEQKILYAVTREDNSLYSIDLATKKVTSKLALGSEAYTCLLSKDKKILFISLWGGDKILYYDIAAQKISATINVGDNPNEMCLDKSGNRLFVANSNDNSVSVIDVKTQTVIETLNAALYPNAPSGSTSNSVAINKKGTTLYIANADNNCLAAFDISESRKSKSKGFIPVGWYPTNVKVIGKKIFVANGKGFSSLANPYGPNPLGKKQAVNYQQSDNQKEQPVQYIGGLFTGTMSVIDEPNDKELSVFSTAVYSNTPYNKNKELLAEGEAGNPIPMKVGESSPIKYVFYIIKENRTFDQVLSDIPGGNGDTSLLLFGEKITPNQHALAKEFVLLDNFYVDAEVSADGHNWSMGAYATDYLEKTWPTSYGGRGGAYTAEGNRAIANNKDGFIWDLCKRSNVSYRTYGEFADKAHKPQLNSLIDHTCPNFTGWDMSTRDTVRFRQWKNDFDSLVAINALPTVNTIRMGNDHTEGMKAGKPTPFAHAADNDLAIGLFIEYLSNSKVWKESAVFILEDDAQNGPDHVDAHRSTAYVISPYVKRNSIDHTMYSTSSVLRTIELIAGMPPMTQYDAAATPMWRCFTANANTTAFTALPVTINLNDKNPSNTAAAKASASLNFNKEDGIPDLLFNEILWQGIKGTSAPAPARAAFVKLGKKKKDDDD
jgi:YVTN family beta-propeller protein